MSSQRVSICTFFKAKRNRCLSLSSVLGAESLYVVSSTIIQMVSRVFILGEFAGRSSFGTFGLKFANSSDAMLTWSVHCLFSLQGFPTFVGHISPSHCTWNFDIVKLKFLFTFQSCQIITHYTYSFFNTISYTVCKTTAIYSLEFPWFVF